MSHYDKIQELKELDSMLGGLPSQNIYSVPEGYFEDLAIQVLKRVKALEAGNAGEELTQLSPLLSGISKVGPFELVGGYFDGFEEKIMATIRQSEDYQTAGEELSVLSPLLSGIGKQNPYTVPQGYFENFGNNIYLKSPTQQKARTVSMVNRKWFRYAAAAIVVGFIALTGIQFLNNNSGGISHPTEVIDLKNVSTDDINNFILVTDEGATEQTSVAKSDIKDLMKDVSDKDLQDFLNKTSAETEETDADILLN